MTPQFPKKPVWQKPWHFTESILIVVGIYLVGMMLQLSVGTFKFSNLDWPLSIIIGGSTIFLVVILSLRRQSTFFQWLSGVPFSVTLIGALIIQTIIMGFTPQIAGALMHKPNLFDIIGFTRMTSSWPFILIYFFTLIALTAAVCNRLKMPKWRDYAFYLNHIGILIFLFASGFGASDMKRYVMYVEEKAEMPEWRVYSENKDVLELPIAISLKDFIMEEYAPKLTIIGKESGKSIPEKNPAYFQLADKKKETQIEGWNIKVDSFIMDAVRNSDKTYREIHMPGSCPAALVTVQEKGSSKKISGWVCCGNYAQLYMPMAISDKYRLVMTRPEPKRFASDIEVLTSSGEKVTTVLEVNKPLKIGSWTIYQYGYDNDAGKASNYSSFELVYDPWLNAVYLGIILCALGSFCLFWIGNKKRKERKND
jgi:ResB-like family